MSVTERKITDINQVKEEVEFIMMSRDITHKHSKAIQEFLSFYIHFIENLVEVKKSGKDVILVAFTDCNFVYSCGAIPIDYTHMVRLCTQASMKEAEEYFQIPAEVCQMSKGQIGAYYEYKDVFKKLLFGSFGCELQFAIEQLMKPFGYSTFVFDSSLYKKANSPEGKKTMRDHYRDELEREARWISGEGVNKERLAFELHRANRLTDKALRLRELQRIHPTYMGCLPSMLVYTGRSTYYGDPERYERLLDAIIAEFEALPEDSYNEKRISLVWSGARGIDFSIYVAMDVLGAHICAWDVAGTGLKKFDETKDPLEAYLDYMMGDDNQSGGLGFVSSSIEDNVDTILKLYEETHADGIYINIIQGCTHGTMNSEMVRQKIAQMGIPTLALNVMQQTGESAGQTITRVKAFLEMLS